MTGDTGILKLDYPNAAQEALRRRQLKNKEKMLGLDEDDIDDQRDRQTTEGD